MEDWVIAGAVRTARYLRDHYHHMMLTAFLVTAPFKIHRMRLVLKYNFWGKPLSQENVKEVLLANYRANPKKKVLPSPVSEVILRAELVDVVTLKARETVSPKIKPADQIEGEVEPELNVKTIVKSTSRENQLALKEDEELYQLLRFKHRPWLGSGSAEADIIDVGLSGVHYPIDRTAFSAVSVKSRASKFNLSEVGRTYYLHLSHLENKDRFFITQLKQRELDAMTPIQREAHIFRKASISAWVYQGERWKLGFLLNMFGRFPAYGRSLQSDMVGRGFAELAPPYKVNSTNNQFDIGVDYVPLGEFTEQNHELPEALAFETERLRWAQRQAQLKQIGPVWNKIRSEFHMYSDFGYRMEYPVVNEIRRFL